jgi:hypothetical protein
MTDEERDTIRTKLLLMDTGTLSLPFPAKLKWCVVKINTTFFRFHDGQLRVFYETEDEALLAGLENMLAKRKLTIVPWESEEDD